MKKRNIETLVAAALGLRFLRGMLLHAGDILNRMNQTERLP